jgi:hypothetical protein
MLNYQNSHANLQNCTAPGIESLTENQKLAVTPTKCIRK